MNKNLNRLKPYANLKRRQAALGEVTDFIKDKLITWMTENAETIFIPKRIITSNDWLATQKENDQTFKSYWMSQGNIKWISK